MASRLYTSLAAVLFTAICCSPGGSAAAPPLKDRGPTLLSKPSPIAGCRGPGQLIDVPEEPSVSADARDRRHLVAAWQQDRRAAGAAFGIAVAVSRNGGDTWRETMLPGLTQCARGVYRLASDPWTAIGPDGAAYVGALGVDPTGRVGTAVAVSTSRDGGASWGNPIVVASVDPASATLDKPSILADPKHAGRVYAVWANYPRGLTANYVALARSDDAGRTWTRPVTVYRGRGESQNNLLMALPDGSVVDLFVEESDSREGAPARVAAARSNDGGATWSAPVTVANFQFTVTRDPQTGAEIRSIGQDIAATISRGRLYVTWFENHREGTSSIWLSTSKDDGVTWSAPRTLVEEAAQAFLPTLAAAGDGRLGVTWYDLRNSSAGPGLGTEVWCAVSSDQGASWRSRKLDGPFDLRLAPTSSLGLFVGDYEGLAGLDTSFASVYVRTPSAGQQPGTEVAFARFS